MLRALETGDIKRAGECRCALFVHVNLRTIFSHQKVTRTRFCAVEPYRANFSGSMMRTPLKRVKTLQTGASQEM